MTQDRPLLSICIPTRNRQQHVEATLERELAPGRFPFPIEVVLSDNASTDATPEIARRYAARGLPLRYHRHAEDKGVYVNIFSCLRRARGVFAVYLADDDRLDVAALVAAIGDMQATPDCVASYGPLEIVDDATGQSRGLTYAIADDLWFDRDNRLAAAKFIVEKHVIPEVAVFRTTTLSNNLFLSRGVHWTYRLLDRLIEIGRVRFRARPHYVWRAPGRDSRIAINQTQGLEEHESHVRGMRLIYYSALRAEGARIGPAERVALEAEIARFGNYFLNQAVYTVAMRGQLAEAVDIIKLLCGAGTIDRDGALDTLTANSAAAVFRVVCDIMDQAGDVDTLVLHGFGPSAQAIANGFKLVRPATRMLVCDGDVDLDQPERAIVLIADETARDGLAARGLLSGHVICLAAMIANFDLAPWLDAGGTKV